MKPVSPVTVRSAFAAKLRLPPVVNVLTVVPVPNWAEPCTPNVEPGSLVLTPTVALPFPTVRVVPPTLKAFPATVQVSQVILRVKFADWAVTKDAVTEEAEATAPATVAEEPIVKLPVILILCDSIWDAVTEDLNVADEVAVKLATVRP